MVARTSRILGGCAVAAFSAWLGAPRLSAHETNVHRFITEAALAYMVEQHPELKACRPRVDDKTVVTLLDEGVTAEDDTIIPVPFIEKLVPFGNFMNHFSPPLVDVVNNGAGTEVFSSCGSFKLSAGEPPDWAFSGGPCLQTMTVPGSTQHLDKELENEFTFKKVLEFLRAYPDDGRKAQGIKGVGHLIHLVQDLTSPAHVLNDAHPPVEFELFRDYLGDPSALETYGARHGQPLIGPFPAQPNVSTLQEAAASLRDYVQRHFLSEKALLKCGPPALLCLDPETAPTICVNDDPSACGYYIDGEGRILGVKKKRTVFPQFYIDEYVAKAQYQELTALAVAYTARVLWLIHQQAPLCEQDITVKVVGSGRVTASANVSRPDHVLTPLVCDRDGLRGCSTSFPSGSQTTLFAMPTGPGSSVFAGWELDDHTSSKCSGTNQNCTITFDGDEPTHIRALFKYFVSVGTGTVHRIASGTRIDCHGTHPIASTSDVEVASLWRGPNLQLVFLDGKWIPMTTTAVVDPLTYVADLSEQGILTTTANGSGPLPTGNGTFQTRTTETIDLNTGAYGRHYEIDEAGSDITVEGPQCPFTFTYSEGDAGTLTITGIPSAPPLP